jgi:hypothetical protein
MPIFFLPSVLTTNSAPSLPCTSSVKQTRKTKGPTLVTSGFVEEGVIIGIFLRLATMPPALDRADATSPRMATTLSRSMSCRTLFVASCGDDLSSS